MPPRTNQEYLEGWDNAKAAALHKEVMNYPYDKNPKVPSYVQEQVDAIVHFPLGSPWYAAGLQYVHCNLLGDRQAWLTENVAAVHLERAFRVLTQGTKVTSAMICDMAAALYGVVVVAEYATSAFAIALKERFNGYGTQFWGLVQTAVEDGRLKRCRETEMFAEIGLHMADVSFSLAFWRCRHALRLLSNNDRDPISFNGNHIYAMVNDRLTDDTKAQLAQVSRTDEGREMLADAVARWTKHYSVTYTKWSYLIQLVPVHILFTQQVKSDYGAKEATYPIQDYCLQFQRFPQELGKQWYKPHNKSTRARRMSLRYIIGVDKAILKHQIRLAKTPIHTLPYEVVQVVYEYIYGPHSFPSCFFSRFFTPTKGTCPDH